MLHSTECNLKQANDGLEALEILQSYQADIILMDCQMPILDGFAASKQIRIEGLNTKTPIIAITANAMSQDKQACEQVGMDDFLAKPIDFNSLEQMLIKWSN